MTGSGWWRGLTLLVRGEPEWAEFLEWIRMGMEVEKTKQEEA